MGPSGGPVKINRGGEPWLTHPGLTKNGLRLVGTGRGRMISPNGESPEALDALVIGFYRSSRCEVGPKSVGAE